jgi:acyl-CoA reductase-like NAD-dependent aldehyde dehydrogenase
VLVVLAGNVPGLAVQPLLPALALGRSVILKSSSAEPWFAPAFVAALARREPALGVAVTALAWRGGDEAVEAPLLAACDPVLAYGDAPAIADLRRRAAGRVIAYGPKTSLAVVGPEADPAAVAEGLARDVALFDQRGCLSIAAVYVAGDGSGDGASAETRAEAVAAALAAELADLAAIWPPGPATAGELAAVRHFRDESTMAGARLVPLAPAAGAVVLDSRRPGRAGRTPRPLVRPAPGSRARRLLRRGRGRPSRRPRSPGRLPLRPPGPPPASRRPLAQRRRRPARSPRLTALPGTKKRRGLSPPALVVPTVGGRVSRAW